MSVRAFTVWPVVHGGAVYPTTSQDPQLNTSFGMSSRQRVSANKRLLLPLTGTPRRRRRQRAMMGSRAVRTDFWARLYTTQLAYRTELRLLRLRTAQKDD